ncbi:MAG: cytochrome c [Deltaproteobacteria bacterium]|nr:cytochrome c [Deltaproteobacteria bacterium]
MLGRKHCVRYLLCFVGILFCIAALASLAMAFPWDTDMNKLQSYKANELTRSPVKGSVPIGYKPFTMTSDEAATQLKNPTEFSANSVWRGRRLWSANCAVCHGSQGDGNTSVGKVINVVSLLTDFYKGREDGRAFAVITNGQAGMPRYGFKFSEEERWDLVNYLRFLQGRELSGIPRTLEDKKE